MNVRPPVARLDPIVDRLIDEVVQREAWEFLCEIPEEAIPAYFPPLRIKAIDTIPGADDCNCDGYFVGGGNLMDPTILYKADVVRARALFTLLHELAHYLIAEVAPELLDPIDQIAKGNLTPQSVEELVCNRFAARLLIPDAFIQTIPVGFVPDDVVELFTATNASWETVCIRISERLPSIGAVVLLREQGKVSYVAAGPALLPWSRESSTAPTGPLSAALSVDSSATQTDRYRWDLPFEQTLFCSTKRVHDGLAVAVMRSTPFTQGLSTLPEAEPHYDRAENWCESCNEERTDGWCDRCRGRRCPDCKSCRCTARRSLPSRTCSGCGLVKAESVFSSPSAQECRDCE